MRRAWVGVGAAFLMLGTAAMASPKDGTGAFATGRYRNLFAEQLGVDRASVHRKIERAFRQLFHGDGQVQRVYFETGANHNGPLAYITDWANNDVRTEGMSYGMMIAVELGHKREFDALWNWSKAYMQITDTTNPSSGYFAWSFNTDGTPRATGAAPDGEEYYAMALLFAAHRWGSGRGIYNYEAEAEKILRRMRHHPLITEMPPFRIHPKDRPFIPPSSPWPSPNNRRAAAEAAAQGKPWPPAIRRNLQARPVTVGPMVDEKSNMIRFVPEVGISGTDASYHLPAFYELWARWGPAEDRAFWARAAEVSRDFFSKVTGPNTGLAPDRSNFDGTPATSWDGKASQFGYDSWRTVSNWSVDYSWWHKNPAAPSLSQKLQHFLIGQGIRTFPDRYTTDGKPLSNRHSPGMVATAAVGGLSESPDADSKAFLQELWNMPVPFGEQRYYDGMLYLMSLMHCAGEFRIILPHEGVPSRLASRRSKLRPSN